MSSGSIRGAMRARVAWKRLSGPSSGRNGLGRAWRESGQRRVPPPPARITAYIGRHSDLQRGLVNRRATVYDRASQLAVAAGVGGPVTIDTQGGVMHATRSARSVWGMAAALTLVVAACASPAATPTKAPTSAPTSAPTTAPSTAPAGTPTTAPTGTPTTAPATATAGATPTASGPTATMASGLTGTLNVLEWVGYDDPLYWADFQKANPEAVANFTFGE